MDTIKGLIKKKTGLTVEILTSGYDRASNIYYSCCVFGSVLCYVEIAENKNHLIICTDDKTTLTNISEILRNRENSDVMHSTTNETPYYMYDHMLICVT